MGAGYSLHCDSCGKDQEVFLGVGMMYPSECKEMLAEVKAGRHGQELKAAAESEPYVGVAADRRIYVCEECGYWEVRTDASVYGLADAEKGPGAMFGDKSIAEWGEIPYVAKWADKGKYRLIKEYVPECERCGGPMRGASSGEDRDPGLRLKCNCCGHWLSPGGMSVCWD